MPIDQSVASAAPAFQISQTGTGPGGVFRIGNADDVSPALEAETDAASLLPSSTGSPASPAAGAGAHAAVSRSLNPGNTDATLLVEKSAFGPVGQFENPGGSDGVFVLTRTVGGNAGLRVTNISEGFAAVFSGDQKGVRIETNGGAGRDAGSGPPR